MTESAHEKRLKKIEAETVEIKRQIMRLEFQQKKNLAVAKKDFEERDKQIQKRLDYVAKLAGITYEELDNLDLKVQEAGLKLSQPRQHSTLS